MSDSSVLGKSGFFSGNQLKIIALVAMTCDHVGKVLLPKYEILQIVGRLAFPIFAYMIAEGCRYTRNRGKHLLQVVLVAILCQIVYFVVERSLFQCILVTFSLSIGMNLASPISNKSSLSEKSKIPIVCIGTFWV